MNVAFYTKFWHRRSFSYLSFGHYGTSSLTHPMLITALDRFRPEGLWEARNEVESQSPANELVDFPRAHSDSYHNALNLLIFQSI